MSVLSTLALLVSAAFRPKPDRQIERLERELATERSLSLHWLGEAQRVIAEKRELERERDMWRERALRPIPLGGQHFRPPERGQALLQQYARAQQHNEALLAQQAQVAQQQYGAMQQTHYPHQQAGAQALDPGMFCNCVPSRAQVWAAERDGDT